MQILGKIVKNAKTNRMEIKKIKLGSKIKKIFKNPFILNDLNNLIQDKNLPRKIRKMEKDIKESKRRLKLMHKHYKKKKILKKKQKPRKLGGTSVGAAPGAGANDNMKFNFLPGFAGMPFPPFMMNGPHFHPPIDVTVNSIPNPNPKADLNPFEIEKSNLNTQISELGSIKTKLLGLDSQMNTINQQITDGLDDKYTKIMQLNV